MRPTAGAAAGAAQQDALAASLSGPVGRAVRAALSAGAYTSQDGGLGALSRDDVVSRLRAADLGGLAEVVWECLQSSRASETPPTLAGPPPATEMERGTGPILEEPAFSASKLLRPLPLGAPSHRGGGLPPRGEESWQLRPDETCPAGCGKATYLLMYNLTGTCICTAAGLETQRRA